MKGVKKRKTSRLPKEKKAGATRKLRAHARGWAQDLHDVGSSSNSRARGGMMREGR
jgi:hypothetical protein